MAETVGKDIYIEESGFKKPLKYFGRAALIATVYFGINAAVDFGSGIEARSTAQDLSSQSPPASAGLVNKLQSDEQNALHDAERQALEGLAAGGMFVIARRAQQQLSIK